MSVEIQECPIGDELRRGRGKKLLHDFLEVASYIFRDDSNWVRPLDFELKERLSPKNPFFEHAEGQLFVAYRSGKPVGRCTAQIDREHLARYRDDRGFFGFLDTVDDPEVAKALLTRAEGWLRGRGMKHVRGPMNLGINEEIGTLVDGFDTPPMIMMPHSRSYQGGLIEEAGYKKEKDVFAWKYITANVPERARKAAAEIEKLPEVTVRRVDMKNLERDVRIVMTLFNDAWSDNWGFVPLTESELKKMAADMRLLLVPDLTLLVSIDGEPAGVCLALPNLNALTRDFEGKLTPTTVAKLLWRLKIRHPDQARLIILGISKRLRHVRKYAGLSTFMYTKINDAGERIGIRFSELGWTLEDNGPVNVAIKFMGGKKYKTYRIYEKALVSE